MTFFQLDGFSDAVCVSEQGVELLQRRDALFVRGLVGLVCGLRLCLPLTGLWLVNTDHMTWKPVSYWLCLPDRGCGLVDHLVNRVEDIDDLYVFFRFVICFYLFTWKNVHFQFAKCIKSFLHSFSQICFFNIRLFLQPPLPLLQASDAGTEAGAEYEGSQEVPGEQEAGQGLGGGRAQADVETPGALDQAEAGETEGAEDQGGRRQAQQAAEAHTQAAEDSDHLRGRGGDHHHLQEEAHERGQVG